LWIFALIRIRLSVNQALFASYIFAYILKRARFEWRLRTDFESIHKHLLLNNTGLQNHVTMRNPWTAKQLILFAEI